MLSHPPGAAAPGSGPTEESMPNGPIAIRPARPADIPALLEMQARSMRQLGRELYTPREIETFLALAGTMDPVLVEDGTYWVAERPDGRIAASGGWSRRVPGYAAWEGGPPAPGDAMPRVRSVFVDPDHARTGLGRAVMARAEAEIAAQGFGQAELLATLMGVPFYAALGWRVGRPVVLRLGPGLNFIGLGMAKVLPLARGRAA
jgi:GNAT superfamily N-acetyltransferase